MKLTYQPAPAHCKYFLSVILQSPAIFLDLKIKIIPDRAAKRSGIVAYKPATSLNNPENQSYA